MAEPWSQDREDALAVSGLSYEAKGDLVFQYNPDGLALQTFLGLFSVQDEHNETVPIKSFIIEGPLASGSSTVCCHKLFMMARMQEPAPHDKLRHTRFIVIRNTFKELLSSTIKTWMDWYAPLGRLVTDPPPRFFLKWADIDCEIWFVALDRPEHVQKIRSTEFTGGWWNEVQYSDLELYAELSTRIGRYPPKRWWTKPGSTEWLPGIPDDFRVPTHKMIIGDMNTAFEDHWTSIMFRGSPLPQDMPEGASFAAPRGWVYVKQPPAVLEKLDAETLRPTGQYVVNARSEVEKAGGLASFGIDPKRHLYAENLNWAGGGRQGEAGGIEYYQDAINSHRTDPGWIRMTLMGVPGSRRTGTRIYPEFFEHLHCSREPLSAHPMHTLIVGIDPGFVRSGVTFLQKVDGRWYVLSDLMRQNVKTEVLGDAIWDHIAQHYRDHVASKNIRFWIDPFADRTVTTGGEKHIEILRNKCNIHAQKSAKANFVRRSAGVDIRKQTMASVARRAVGEHRGILIGPNAPYFKRGVLGTYVWKSNADGVVLEPAEVDKTSIEADVVESAEYALVGEGEARDALGRSAYSGEPVDVRAGVNLFDRPKSSVADRSFSREFDRDGRSADDQGFRRG